MSKASKDRRNALPATSAKQVLFEIGNEHFDLVHGKGHWYFVYDDGVTFDTYSVLTMRLSDLTVNQWAEEGRAWAQILENNK